MVRGKGMLKERKILTEGEKQDIMGQRQEVQSTLNQVQNYGAGTGAEGIDRANLQKKIEHYDKILDDGKATRVRGTKKDDMIKRAEYLAVELKKGMPTRREMDHPAKCPGAVHKHLNWNERNKGNIKEYKNIQRTLEPQDPTAVDLEKFRKEK